MNFGYSTQKVGDVKALWEGDVLHIPGFERPSGEFGGFADSCFYHHHHATAAMIIRRTI